MDYIARYGLEFNPFLKNSRDIYIETEETKEVRFRLDYLSRTKGFGLLVGAPGLGKTTALRSFAASLSPANFKVIYTGLSTLTLQDFYRHLASCLGAQPCYHKTDNFRLIQSAINHLAVEKRITPFFIIDEANYLNTAVLNDLKILFNFEMDSKDQAAILLVGLPQLNSTLRLGVHEPLRQRIIMNYNMEGLTKEEGRTYIREKLKGAGGTPDIFDQNAMEAVLNAADGTPRMINKLCSASMLVSASRELNCINADAVMQAVSDCELG